MGLVELLLAPRALPAVGSDRKLVVDWPQVRLPFEEVPGLHPGLLGGFGVEPHGVGEGVARAAAAVVPANVFGEPVRRVHAAAVQVVLLVGVLHDVVEALLGGRLDGVLGRDEGEQGEEQQQKEQEVGTGFHGFKDYYNGMV